MQSDSSSMDTSPDDWVDIEKPKVDDLSMRTKPTKSDNKSIEFYATIERAALKRYSASRSPIFHVDLDDEPIYTTFLNNLAPNLRQEYTCSACRQFTDKHGDLALIKEDGVLEPLLWSLSDINGNTEMNDTYARAVTAVHDRFKDKKVRQEFKIVAKTREIGTEKKGGFTHMRLRFPEARVRKAELPGYSSASTAELAVMLDRVLADYDLDTVQKVYSMLKENKLAYADSHKASAKWLLNIIEENKIGKAQGEVARHNLLYRYAASSFVGSLSQMRSGALGTLLENVKADQSWNYITSQWNQVCDPLRYMRPQAAPSEGNIKAAERLFEQLGLTKDDLRRRLLVQSEVPENVIIWASEKMKKKRQAEVQNSIFGSVEPKTTSTLATRFSDAPPVKISFTRFVNQVLPKAKSMHCWLERNNVIATLITGFENSKPLMQWHDEQGKNLASHYIWSYPPAVEKHNLHSFAWNEVRCLIPYPWLWDGAPLTTTFPLVDPDGTEGSQYKYYHKKEGFSYLFVLENNHESNLNTLPLFPQFLKNDFHGVRSTIEAFCAKGKLQDVDDGISKGGFVAGVEAARGYDDQGLKMRVQRFDGFFETYHITLFE